MIIAGNIEAFDKLINILGAVAVGFLDALLVKQLVENIGLLHQTIFLTNLLQYYKESTELINKNCEISAIHHALNELSLILFMLSGRKFL